MNTRCESPRSLPGPAPWRALAACALVVALGACSRGFSAQSGPGDAPPPGGTAGANNGVLTAAAQPSVPPEAMGRVLPDFSQLVEHYGPAVVNVEVVEKAQPSGGVPGLAPNDPFYDFFRRYLSTVLRRS